MASVRDLISPGLGRDSVLLCPSCLDQSEDVIAAGSVHPSAVFIDRGGESTLVTAEGVRNEPLPPTEARGAIIEVRCFCESGHTFTLAFQFHKGSTGVSFRDVGTFRVDGEYAPQTLWRD